ncbi:hypothetical protein Tco_0676247 [Tanacetum coccineum]
MQICPNYALLFVILAFEKHLEEKHVTWAQLGKKRDKNTTLHDFAQALVYRTWRRRQDFNRTPLMFQGDGITNFCDDVKVADMKKP